jgi:hypothetical protein
MEFEIFDFDSPRIDAADETSQAELDTDRVFLGITPEEPKEATDEPV